MGITHTCPMGIKVHLPDGPGDYSLVQTIVYRPTPTCPDEASTKARNAERGGTRKHRWCRGGRTTSVQHRWTLLCRFPGTANFGEVSRSRALIAGRACDCAAASCLRHCRRLHRAPARHISKAKINNSKHTTRIRVFFRFFLLSSVIVNYFAAVNDEFR